MVEQVHVNHHRHSCQSVERPVGVIDYGNPDILQRTAWWFLHWDSMPANTSQFLVSPLGLMVHPKHYFPFSLKAAYAYSSVGFSNFTPSFPQKFWATSFVII